MKKYLTFFITLLLLFSCKEDCKRINYIVKIDISESISSEAIEKSFLSIAEFCRKMPPGSSLKVNIMDPVNNQDYFSIERKQKSTWSEDANYYSKCDSVVNKLKENILVLRGSYSKKTQFIETVHQELTLVQNSNVDSICLIIYSDALEVSNLADFEKGPICLSPFENYVLDLSGSAVSISVLGFLGGNNSNAFSDRCLRTKETLEEYFKKCKFAYFNISNNFCI